MRRAITTTTAVLALLHAIAQAENDGGQISTEQIRTSIFASPPKLKYDLPIETGTIPPFSPSTTTSTPAPLPSTSPPMTSPIPSASKPTNSDANAEGNQLKESSTVTASSPGAQSIKTNTATPSTTTATSTSTASSKNVTSAPSPTSSLRSGDDNNGKDGDTKDGSDYLDTSLANACVCNDVRKVSLMSWSDYCLPPTAVIANKCGNPVAAEKGECPRAGAQPCQDTGHVLASDANCTYDKDDRTYKCVAHNDDINIQKNGKRKKTSNVTRVPSPTSTNAAASTGPTVLQCIVLVVSLVAGLAAVA